MNRHVLLVALVSAAVALTACKKQDATASTQPAAEAAPASADPAANADAALVAKFDIDKVPVSDKPLGAFPYFTLPDGYENPNEERPIADMDRVPFWTGDRLEWVEGRVFQQLIYAKDGKKFSSFELEKNIDHLVEQAGGVKVTTSKIPQEVTDTLDDRIKVDHVDGIGDIYNEPTTTYLIRRANRNIWVHFVNNGFSGNWMIAETAPFVPTAALLPATALKQQLDSAGKVAISVNFASDKAEILADSQPQIVQVVELLKEDAALKLSVNGHTDNSGDKAHNQQLSEARAKSVVAALAAQGVDAARLQAKGFGQDQPVADNASEDGKAKNRRVELVKL